MKKGRQTARVIEMRSSVVSVLKASRQREWRNAQFRHVFIMAFLESTLRTEKGVNLEMTEFCEF